MLELGLDFLSTAARTLVIGIEVIPAVGTLIKWKDSLFDNAQNLEKEQLKLKSIEERLQQIEEAQDFTLEQIQEIVESTVESVKQEGEDVSEEKKEAVLDILSVMPFYIKQKTSSSLKMAEKKGFNKTEVLPISNHSSKEDRIALYSSFFPLRRPMFRKGDKIKNHTPNWIFENVIGMGGFGEVWKVVDKQKMLPPEALKFYQEKNSTEIIRREAENLSTIIKKMKGIPKEETNIVKVTAINVTEEPFFIGFEYIEGGTLEDFIKSYNGNPLPFEDVKKAFVQICKGIAAAHKIDIVHRDLKPANILVDKNEKMYVTDFGLGKILSENLQKEYSLSTSSSFTVLGYGTPGYMSPEQIKCEEHDTRDDVFSLGVILYYLLVGDLKKELMYAIDELSDDSFSVEKEMIEIVETCIFKPRAKRYENAIELLETFEEACKKIQTRAKRRETVAKKKAEREVQ